MKTKILFASLTAVVALTGCGGGGGSSSDGSGTDSGGGSAGGIVAYSCSDSASYGGTSIETKSGYEGDIAYDCKLMSATQGFHLNVGSMSVTDITKVEKFNGTVDGKSMNATTTYDYKNATVHYKGSATGLGNIDCTETYKPFLPVTIASDEETEALLMDGMSPDYSVDYFDYEGPNFVSTTCPSNFYDEDLNIDSPSSMDMVMTQDFTVKDSDGNTHKISIYQKVKM